MITKFGEEEINIQTSQSDVAFPWDEPVHDDVTDVFVFRNLLKSHRYLYRRARSGDTEPD
jgi:hypothetical protein